MSDSDTDLLGNFYNFPSESTIISAKGPNTNVTLQSKRRQQSYSVSNHDQHSMHFRRDRSPMSVASACDARQRMFNRSYYPQGISLHREDNRKTSCASSVGSRDSRFSTYDIVEDLNNKHFYELKQINEACRRHMRLMRQNKRTRKISKRKNLKQFLRGGLRVSGGESGDDGSDSSLSNDERATNFKENMSVISSSKSTRTNFSDFRRTIRESNMYNDCTDQFRQRSYRSIVGGPSQYMNSQTRMLSRSNTSCRSVPVSTHKNSMLIKQNAPAMHQKECFKTGFLLSSQRFPQASSTFSKTNKNVDQNRGQNAQNGNNVARSRCETDSDQDDLLSVFSEQRTNNNVHRKRSIDSDDEIYANPKRSKADPQCNNTEYKNGLPKEPQVNIHNGGTSNDFVFAKPAFPIKQPVKKKIIPPIPDTLTQASVIPPAVNDKNSKQTESEEQEKEIDDEDEPSNASQNSTISSRPSFIKRKLFSQKLAMAEKQNTSIDSLNSPQNSIYGGIQKEKHKARKLQQVTTQSCLSRDLQQDESNILDLINKIVPLNQMNVTNLTNRTDLQCSKNKSEENDDNWDVTSIITEQRDGENVSDTFTDEEIFNATVKELTKEKVSIKPIKTKNANKPLPEKKNGSEITSEKQSAVRELTTERVSNKPIKKNTPNKVANVKKNDCEKASEKQPGCLNEPPKQNCSETNGVKKTRNFWDTDFESDEDCHIQPRRTGLINLKENHETDIELAEFHGSTFNSKTTAAPSANVSGLTNVSAFAQKLNSTSVKIMTHKTPPRRKKPLDDLTQDNTLSEPNNNLQKTSKESTGVSRGESGAENAKNEIQKKCSKKPTAQHGSKQDNKKKPTKKDKSNKSIESVISVTTKTPNKQTKTNTDDISTTKNKANNKIQDENKVQQTKNDEQFKPSRKKQVLKESAQLFQAFVYCFRLSEADIEKNEIQKKNSRKPTTQQASKQGNKKKCTKVDMLNKSTESAKHVTPNKQNKQITMNINDKNTTKRKGIAVVNKGSTVEAHNSSRSLRSCRSSTLNDISTLNVSSPNASMFRSLRSRQIDLSSTLIGNTTIAKQNVNNLKTKSRRNDIIYSTHREENKVDNGCAKRVTNSKNQKKIFLKLTKTFNQWKAACYLV